MTTHIPPELQGKNLRGVERTANHDNFGLAVIIFQLLFLGRHPFAGNFLGAEDKTLEDAIREHLFAYGAQAQKLNVAQPPGTLSLSALPPQIAQLFERAFTLDENRPAPHEWIVALENLIGTLEQCTLNPGHIFYSKLALCPWCAVEEETGLMIFPVVAQTAGADKFYKSFCSAEAVRKLLASFNIPSLAVTPVFYSETGIKPTAEVAAERHRLNQMLALSCFVGFGIIGIGYLESSVVGWITFLTCFITSIIFIKASEFDNSGKQFRRKTRADRLAYELEWESVDNSYQKALRQNLLKKNFDEIQTRIGEYEFLQTEQQKQLSAQAENLAEKSDATALAAADEMDSQILRSVETETLELLTKLRIESVRTRRRQHSFAARNAPLMKNLAQSRVNVRHLGVEFPFAMSIIWLSVMLSFILPHAYPLFESPKTTESAVSTTVSSDEPPPPVKPALVGTESKAPTAIVVDMISGMSSGEIAALTGEQRASYVQQLRSLSSNALYSEKYDEARRLAEIGLRLNPKETALINILGTVDWKKGAYNNSLAQFNRAKAIDPTAADDFYIAMNELSLKNYKKAAAIFSKLAAEKPSNEAFFNLGLAQESMGDFGAAKKSYAAAFALKKNDVDSLYQLATCQMRTRDIEGTKESYALLRELDLQRASRLRVEAAKYFNLESFPPNSAPSN